MTLTTMKAIVAIFTGLTMERLECAMSKFKGSNAHKLRMVIYNYANGRRVFVPQGTFNLEFDIISATNDRATCRVKAVDGVIHQILVVPKTKIMDDFIPKVKVLSNHNFSGAVDNLVMSRRFVLAEDRSHYSIDIKDAIDYVECLKQKYARSN